MEKNHVVNVLDHGFVRLIDWMGSDMSICRNARVSYNAAWRAGEDKGSDSRLINYLYCNGPNTPFESCTITFEVKAPIFVFRQWHRHRTQSYNEVSARYTELPEEFYIPEEHLITTQSVDNKQMRTDDPHELAPWFQKEIGVRNRRAFKSYHDMITAGCPRELARSVLPVGTYSHMFATANLHNWYRFLKERLHPHAQYEFRVYAEQVLAMLAELFPVATQAFKDQIINERITAEKAQLLDQTLECIQDMRQGNRTSGQAKELIWFCKDRLEKLKEW